jgi:hypothetical protein
VPAAATVADFRYSPPVVVMSLALTEVAPEIVPPLIVAPVMVVPATSSGSEKATPTDLVLGIAFSRDYAMR